MDWRVYLSGSIPAGVLFNLRLERKGGFSLSMLLLVMGYLVDTAMLKGAAVMFFNLIKCKNNLWKCKKSFLKGRKRRTECQKNT